MITIVGAGAAGLAMAQALQRRGLSSVVLEQGAIGETWAHHYDRLHLHTHKGASSLPGLPMPAAYPPFPSAAQVQAYLQQYARHFQLQVETGVVVESAAYQQGRWQLGTSRGYRTATVLIAATGIWGCPVIPALPGTDLFGGQIIHASAYRNPAPFVGKRVLVVGAGNSGSEIAAELARAGVATALSIRGGAAFVAPPRSAHVMRWNDTLARLLPQSVIDRTLALSRPDYRGIGLPLPAHRPADAYPVVGFDLPLAVAAGHISVYGALTGYSPGQARFAGGRTLACDTVILATGYRPALTFLRGQLLYDDAGKPLVDAYWRAIGQQHLVCVGYSYPTTAGWLQTIGRVAAEAAEGVSALLQTDQAASGASAAQPFQEQFG